MKLRKLMTMLLVLAFAVGMSVVARAEVVFELPLYFNSIEQDNVMGWATGESGGMFDIGLTIDHLAQGRYLVLELQYDLPNWDNDMHYIQLMLNGAAPDEWHSWRHGGDISFSDPDDLTDPRVALVTGNMIVFDLNPLKMGAGHDDMYFTGWESVQLHMGHWSFPIWEMGLTRAYLASEIPTAPTTTTFDTIFEFPLEFNSIEQDNVMGWATEESGGMHDIGLTVEHFAQGRYLVLELNYELPNWDNDMHYIQLMLNGDAPDEWHSWRHGGDISFSDPDDLTDPRVVLVNGNLIVFDLNPLKMGAGHADMYFTDWGSVQLHIGHWSFPIWEMGLTRAFLANGIPTNPTTRVGSLVDIVPIAEEIEEYEEEVEEEVEEEAAPEPTPEPTPAPTPEPTPEPEADDDGLSTVVIIIIVVAAVVVIGGIVFFIVKKK